MSDSHDDLNDTQPIAPIEQMNRVKKGDDVNLMKLDPSLRRVNVGAGWEIKGYDGAALDIDVVCFLLDRDDMTRVDEDFVFYNNLEGCNGAVQHSGDNRTGAGDGDDEVIAINLQDLPFDIMKITFALSIYDAEMREQNFGGVDNCFLRIVNAETEQELLRFEVDPADFPQDTSILIGSIVREGPKWHFRAEGESVPGGLAALATKTGILVV